MAAPESIPATILSTALCAPASSLETQLNLSLRGYWTGIILGIFILLIFGGKEIYHLGEYEVLYAGARLVGTPYLYDKLGTVKRK
jgi:hypothetical protein